MENSLEIYQEESCIFSSKGKWLHPLFELEDFLNEEKIDANNLLLKDKIAGKAAAFLMVRLGISKVQIELISEGAIEVFEANSVTYSFSQKVAKIQCKTESIIQTSMLADAVWQMLRRRAGRVSGLEINISQLHVNYNEKEVLKGLDLFVGKGEHIFIKGSNGTGKTTLLKTILGLLTPKKGTIKIGDFETGSSTWHSIKNIIGYVHQNSVENKFPISSGEVVAIGLAGQKFKKKEIEHRVEIAMKRTNCFHLVHRSYHELSGGEKQRISLARCICQGARVLLLDEPTSFLDSNSKNEIAELLTEIWHHEAPTAIIVSHDDEWISKFDWPVYELKDGNLC